MKKQHIFIIFQNSKHEYFLNLLDEMNSPSTSNYGLREEILGIETMNFSSNSSCILTAYYFTIEYI